MTWDPPEEDSGIAMDGDELVRKVVTWIVLSFFVVIVVMVCIAMIVGLGKVLF